MKKKYVAPSVEEQEIATVQMICTSLPVVDKNDDKIKAEETLSNGNNDSWNDWDNADDDK